MSEEISEERFIELLVELHDGLPRLGPGNTSSTLRALKACEQLPESPDVLDVGCGTGAQTVTLAEALKSARVTATDLFPAFLASLQATAHERGLGDRIHAVTADMNDLPFGAEDFDLIWSEGAAYIMGFDNALTRWQPLVRSGGYLVVSEISWFHADPPPPLREFWEAQYPAIRGEEDNLAAARRLGWDVVTSFRLPAEAWTEEYYGPVQRQLPIFRERHADDPGAQQVATMTEEEIEMMTAHLDDCGYTFYVLQRP